MDERELVRRVKNSFGAKKSRAEILSGFQKRGYKLAYAEELIKKAERPRKILGASLALIVLFFSTIFLIHGGSVDNATLMETLNPLSGFSITGNVIGDAGGVAGEMVSPRVEPKTTTYDQIDITPEFISYLLEEIGAWQLHKNPLTLENPIINFKIENMSFYSEIGDKIKTNDGLNNAADLEFIINKEDLINALLADNPENIFKESVNTGRTEIKLLVGEGELFAKGYLSLYDGLNP